MFKPRIAPLTLKNYINDTILWIYDIIGVVWIFAEYAWLPKTAGLLKGLAQRSIHLGIWFVRPAAVVAWLAAVVACVGGARATVSTASDTFQYPLQSQHRSHFVRNMSMIKPNLPVYKGTSREVRYKYVIELPCTSRATCRCCGLSTASVEEYLRPNLPLLTYSIFRSSGNSHVLDLRAEKRTSRTQMDYWSI